MLGQIVFPLEKKWDRGMHVISQLWIGRKEMACENQSSGVAAFAGDFKTTKL